MTAQIVHRCELWFAVEEGVVEEAGEETAEERADPVDALIGPMVCGESGAEGARGVEGCAGKGTSDEDAQRDDEADAKAGVGAGRVAVVDGGSEDGEDEE